jgi:glycosyltransferase involved in cell wall biosynthesis
MFEDLQFRLKWQINTKYNGQVEIINDSSTKYTIGEKRNHLLEEAKGKFVVFIDDDDEVSDDYIESIIQAIDSNQEIDCIGMKGKITFDGANEKKWIISTSCGNWYEKDNMYFRTPNHISPVRRDIALKVKFPKIMIGEDYEYSMGILPHLKREVLIDKELYHYKYITK